MGPREQPVIEKTEQELEAFLFNDLSQPNHSLSIENLYSVENGDNSNNGNGNNDDLQALPDDQLFVIDSGSVETLPLAPSKTTKRESEKRVAVWHDEDDEQIEVDIGERSILRKLRTADDETTKISGVEYADRLRSQFERLHAKPAWAETTTAQSISTDGTMGEDEDLKLFRSTGGLLSTNRTGILSADHLDISRVRDANWQEYNQSVVTSLDWHHCGQVLLTAGLDKTLRVFQIDGEENPKLQSIHFKDMPIQQAQFSPSGQEIVLTGHRRFFYTFNIELGRVIKVPGIRGRHERTFDWFAMNDKFLSFAGYDGEIVMLSAQTKQWIHTLKINGILRSIQYSTDGKYIFASGTDGEIYQFDLRQMRCINRFTDEGAIRTTALAVSADGQYCASGSDSGVCNIYNLPNTLASHTPHPVKAVMNLTTKIDQVQFNHDSQLLALSSRVKKDQFRLVHLPSGRVFSNWPTAKTPLSRVQCHRFSPSSGYLAIGNDKGKVLLYRLGAYQQS